MFCVGVFAMYVGCVLFSLFCGFDGSATFAWLGLSMFAHSMVLRTLVYL